MNIELNVSLLSTVLSKFVFQSNIVSIFKMLITILLVISEFIVLYPSYTNHIFI